MTLALPLCALLLAADAGSALPPPAPKARVDPARVKLGDPFVYELVFTHDKAQRFELRTPSDWGAFELLDQKRQRIDGSATATTTFRLQLSVFELGKQKLPDLTFEWVDDSGGTGQTTAPGLEVEAEGSLAADAEKKGEALYDIRGNEVVPVRSWRLVVALAAGLAAVALGYALYRYAKRPRKVKVKPAAPARPLGERTVAALDALRAEDLPGQGRVKEFHFRLSEIQRGFLGERYGFEALESTSDELLASLRRLRTPGLEVEELSRFVFEADLVKFAKATAGPDECKRAIEYAYRLVASTTAPPPPLPENASPQLP